VRHRHAHFVATAEERGRLHVNADHIERLAEHLDALADRIHAAGEETFGQLVVDHRHMGTCRVLGGGEVPPLHDLATRHQYPAGSKARDLDALQVDVLVTDGPVAVLAHGNILDRWQLAHELRVLDCDPRVLPPRRQLIRPVADIEPALEESLYEEGLRAGRLEHRGDAAVDAGNGRRHRDDDHDTDGDAEDGEPGSHLVGANGVQGNADALEKTLELHRRLTRP